MNASPSVFLTPFTLFYSTGFEVPTAGRATSKVLIDSLSPPLIYSIRPIPNESPPTSSGMLPKSLR